MGKGISFVYISQPYFEIPGLVQKQFNYLVLLKLSSKNDLQLILSEYSLGLDRKELEKIYKDATKETFHFFKIDINNPDDNKKFSKNFTDFYKITDEDKEEVKSEDDEDKPIKPKRKRKAKTPETTTAVVIGGVLYDA